MRDELAPQIRRLTSDFVALGASEDTSIAHVSNMRNLSRSQPQFLHALDLMGHQHHGATIPGYGHPDRACSDG